MAGLKNCWKEPLHIKISQKYKFKLTDLREKEHFFLKNKKSSVLDAKLAYIRSDSYNLAYVTYAFQYLIIMSRENLGKHNSKHS